MNKWGEAKVCKGSNKGDWSYFSAEAHLGHPSRQRIGSGGKMNKRGEGAVSGRVKG